MPRRSAAWMTVTPSSTSMLRPSISTVGMGSTLRRLRPEGTPSERDVLLELGTELVDEGPRRHRRAVGEGADGVPLDVVGDAQEELHVPRNGAALLESAQHAIEPARALPAGRALPARLVVEECDHVVERPHHADRIVHHHDAGRAEERSRLLHGVHVHRHVDLVGGERRHRGAARDHRLQLPAVRDAAGVLVDDLAQRRAHGQLVDAGPHDVARDAVQLGAGALLRSDAAEPSRPAQYDVRHAREGLDVVHDGGTVEETLRGGERWLDARVATLALERLEQPRLLAADVGTGTAVDDDLELEAGTEDVLADEAGRLGLAHGLPQALVAEQHLATDVDVGEVALDGVRGDDDAFEELVRVVLDDDPVLERARLALVRVDRQVDRLLRLLRQEAPLHAGREARAAAPTDRKSTRLNSSHLGISYRERLADGLVAAVLAVGVQTPESGNVPAARQEALGHASGQLAATAGSLARNACF